MASGLSRIEFILFIKHRDENIITFACCYGICDIILNQIFFSGRKKLGY